MKRVGILALALVLALGVLGVGYAMWDENLTVEGLVLTGEVSVEIMEAFTDDDGGVDDPEIDLGDDGGGTLYDFWGGASSDDPLASQPLPPRGDKDVGRSHVAVVGPDTATLVIENGYPCYYTTAYFRFENNGTVPVKLQMVEYHQDTPWKYADGDPQGLQVSVEECEWVPQHHCVKKWVDWDNDCDWDEVLHSEGVMIGDQIDPGESGWFSLDIHVEQGAEEGAVQSFDIRWWFVQWNEFEEP